MNKEILDRVKVVLEERFTTCGYITVPYAASLVGITPAEVTVAAEKLGYNV